MTYPLFRLSIVDENMRLAGYIDVPDPDSRKIMLGSREFVVLSRSTVDGKLDLAPDILGESRRQEKIRWFQAPVRDRYGWRTQAHI
jgi:hypothetical protein